MIKYKISVKNPAQHFIQFEMSIDVKDQNELLIQLPVWRPGRYELGNFAKNVKGFGVTDQGGKKLKYEKTAHSSWLISCKNASLIIVHYQYFANELNAGSTYLNEDQLYINPVNCFFYVPEMVPHKYELQFELPKKYKIASTLKKIGAHGLKSKDHFELFDSPLIASDNWQRKTYVVDKINFHVMFQGVCKPDWKRILADFEQFTRKQIQCFGSFPVNEYWFYVQTPSYRKYHGVEHEKSTVIALGPGYDLMTDKVYNDLLGVCSHELYHTWNVKNIKPIEFTPFDFSKENYNRIGFVIEGVTTYMGDKMLWKSGVKNDDWFRNEMSTQFQRHMWNEGRFNHSVKDSSYDTWLDGYVAGIPGRKVSIYTEGALLALILDIEIQDKTKGKKSLDSVMKVLYKKFGSAEIGYREKDFWDISERVYGGSLSSFYNNFHNNAVSYEKRLKAALKKLNWKVVEDNSMITRACYGLIVDDKSNIQKVHSMSDASSKGIAEGDKIIAINDHVVNGNLTNWITFYNDENKITLLLESSGKLKKVILKKSKSLYAEYRIESA
ncbi:MAG: putative metalloprotease with PDZ domain [Patiriisocius sp.]|jgi:predicted metalloprotease with PDZ domain